MSATDIRQTVTMLSEGGISIRISDPNIGALTRPTRMLATFGLREEGTTSLGDGTVLHTGSVLSGQRFVRD